VDSTVPSSSKFIDMADEEKEHTWACSKWDWSYEDTDWQPGMSMARTDCIRFSTS